MITGLLTPQINKNMCFPYELINKIDKNWIIDGKTIEEVFKAYEIKKSFFIKKLKEKFDLFIFIIRVPDCISHHPKVRLKKTYKAIEEGYNKIDDFLGIIIENVEFDNIFIISDHGLKLYQHEFNIKRFLEKKKLLLYNNDSISKLLSILIKILGNFNINFFNTTYFHNKIKKLLAKIKLNNNDLFKSTKFIHFYSNYGGIYLSETDKKKKELIKEILLNSKYVKDIKTYDSDTLPDLIIILKDKYLYSVKSSFFVKNRFNSINHQDEGIFIAYGKNIKKNKMEEVKYVDFAPTLLRLYNINKLNHMKGDILDIFKKN
jgi:predicted AlkP superfamily phosphohydrolase/phosphomutase